jgi:hypothetical protein
MKAVLLIEMKVGQLLSVEEINVVVAAAGVVAVQVPLAGTRYLRYEIDAPSVNCLAALGRCMFDVHGTAKLHCRRVTH